MIKVSRLLGMVLLILLISVIVVSHSMLGQMQLSTNVEHTSNSRASTPLVAVAKWIAFRDSIHFQQEKMCGVKYPPATIEMLKRTLAIRGVRRVAIVSILKDCVEQLLSIERAILQVAEVLSPENVFVSLLESGSGPNDQTPTQMREMRHRLQARGVSNVISTGVARTSAVWKNNMTGSRIGFLARLRNAAMVPALDGHPEGYFDKFFFVNDVYICGGDILRLLAHDSDMACGLDFEQGLVLGELYDKWVHNEWLFEEFDFVKFEKDGVCRNKINKPAFNVFSCWNGGIAAHAHLWYNGIRFREGMRELGTDDCSQSECSLWSMDAHTLGYHNVVLDTTVQTGYGWSPYVANFHDSSPEIKSAVISPNVASTKVDVHNISYRCCEIQGSDTGVSLANCHNRKLVTPGRAVCAANTTKCLRYSPSRWVENWDWKPLLRRGYQRVKDI